jgi:uncharacterized phage protein (TIGR01671 family)
MKSLIKPREIKFRAWDTYNERMVYQPNSFRPSNEYDRLEIEDGIKVKCPDHRFNAPFVYFETWNDEDDGISRPCFITQFTGQKDKNGKEIWEGDIVKRIHKIINHERLSIESIEAEIDPYDYHEQISFVRYVATGFWVEGEGFGWEGEDMWDWDQMEVIGNVFENPEQLPKKKKTTKKRK